MLFLKEVGDTIGPSLVEKWRTKVSGNPFLSIYNKWIRTSLIMFMWAFAFAALLLFHISKIDFGLKGKDKEMLQVIPFVSAFIFLGPALLCVVIWNLVRPSGDDVQFLKDVKELRSRFNISGKIDSSVLGSVREIVDEVLDKLAYTIYAVEAEKGKTSRSHDRRDNFKKFYDVANKFGLAEKNWDLYFERAAKKWELIKDNPVERAIAATI